jgi:hypothetical protein
MKRLSVFVLFSAILASSACKMRKSENSGAKSHEDGGLTDEEYYAKAEIFLRFFPCFSKKDITREGDKVTIHVNGGDPMSPPLMQCIEPLKMFPTLWDIVQVDETDAIIRIMKTTTAEVVGDYFTKAGPEGCVTKFERTEKGMEFTFKESAGEECKQRFAGLQAYFEVLENSDKKLVLGYITKGFTCSTEGNSASIRLFKDFSDQETGELFDPISFATYEKKGADGNVEKGTIRNCHYKINLGDQPMALTGELDCISDDEKFKHKILVGFAGMKSTATIDGQEQQTKCKSPDGSEGL